MEVRNISIKSVRVAKGLTQKDLAEKIGVNQSAVSLWEKGSTGPVFARLAEIAKVLECTVDELIQDDRPSGDTR